MKSIESCDRAWHDNFKKYTEFIVASPAYKGLFYERKADGTIKWVVTGKSKHGKLRQAWWDAACRRLGIPIDKGCYAIAARMIHPTKIHVCQCCGKPLSILYVCPNKNLLKSVNNYFGINLRQSDYTIFEIIDKYCFTQECLDFIAGRFHLRNGLDSSVLKKQIKDKCLKPLSPGAMSNCPDRFDGYHSDGLCCRERTDKGRHSDKYEDLYARS